MAIALNELRVGDVMLKLYHGGVVHWLIRTLTANEGSARHFVHEALYLGNGEIWESIGAGYSFTPRMSQGHNYRYFVFRYADLDLADVAAHIPSTWVIVGHGGVQGYRAPGRIANRQVRAFGGYGLGQAAGGAVSNIRSTAGGRLPPRVSLSGGVRGEPASTPRTAPNSSCRGTTPRERPPSRRSSPSMFPPTALRPL